jgi:hypothetical protein
MINGDRPNSAQTPVACPGDLFSVRSALLAMRKACLLHRRGANSSLRKRHPGNPGGQ